MRTFIIILLSFFALSCFCQEDLLLGSSDFDRRQFKEVLIYSDCNNCDPPTKNQKVASYSISGSNIIKTTFCERKPCGIKIFEFKADKMLRYTNKETWVSTSNIGDFGMQWDSSITSLYINYEYDEYSKKERYYNGQTDRLESEKVYQYDIKQRLVKVEIKDFPNPDYFATFNPNDTASFYDKDEKILTTRRKEFTYQNDSTVVKFFKKDSLTGIQYIVKIGNTTIKDINDAQNKPRSRVIETYNKLGQLVEIKTKENGYDGFGNGYDFIKYDKETLSYDLKGRISVHEYYNNDELIISEKYLYK
jgi:hypothetical protein